MLVYRMFEPFSGSYYLGRLYVEPHETDAPAIARSQYEAVQRQLYDATAGEEETPLVMKLDRRHFPVVGVEAVPADTLAVPPAIVADSNLENPPSLREVFLATADRAEQLLALTGDTGASPSEQRSNGGRPTGI